VLPPQGQEELIGVAHLVQDPADPATADIAVTVVDDWQGRGAGTALVSALMQRRPAAVTRLRTLVAAGNRASLALLARAGRVSPGLPERGVLDVTVELPPATRARSAVKKVADFWTQGAAWTSHPGNTRTLGTWARGFDRQGTVSQVAVFVAGLLAVTASAFTVAALATRRCA